MKRTKTVIGEACIVGDGAHAKIKRQPTGVQYFTSKNIKTGKLDLTDVDFISNEDFEQHCQNSNKAIKRPIKNDVLLCIIGASVGDSCFVPEDPGAGLSSSVALLRAKETILDPKYLYYWTRGYTFQDSINRTKSGAAQSFLSQAMIKALPLEYPELSEQKRIAEILSTYDALIENNRRRIQLLEQSARSLYKEWFVHLRFPGHEHVAIVNGVPEGWEKVFVPEVILINPKENIEKGKEVFYVPMSSLSESGMTVDRTLFERRTEHTSVKFRNGDVLFARITPCLENGKTAFVYFLEPDEIACGSTEFIVLRGAIKVSSYFIYCLSRSHEFRHNAIKSMIGSSGRQRVQISCFNEFSIGIPPAFLLEQFDDFASNCFHQIATLSSQNYSLTKARNILLPRLMSGDIAI